MVLTMAPALVLCSMTRSADVPVRGTAIIFLVSAEAWSNWAPHPPTMVPFSVCVIKGTEKSQGQFGMCRSRHSLAMSYVMAAARSVRTNSLSRQAAGTPVTEQGFNMLCGYPRSITNPEACGLYVRDVGMQTHLLSPLPCPASTVE